MTPSPVSPCSGWPRAGPTPAVAAVTRALDEAREPARRAKLLPAYVAVVLAAGDVDAGRRAADELDRDRRAVRD